MKEFETIVTAEVDAIRREQQAIRGELINVTADKHEAELKAESLWSKFKAIVERFFHPFG